MTKALASGDYVFILFDNTLFVCNFALLNNINRLIDIKNNI